MANPDAEANARFERLFPLVRDPLVRYLARRAAPDAVEDLFAEVLAVAWRRRADLPVGEELPWLYGTARRVLANHRRAGSRFGRLLERLAFHQRSAGPGPAAGRAAGDLDLDAAMAALSAVDAEVLRLWAWEELAPREIGAVLGISANAASIRLHRAKERLRSRLETERGKTAMVAGHVPGIERKETR
ncbi:MAG: sigma-70 family RNA polymerase sigma factor [Chloroflexota bacterium]